MSKERGPAATKADAPRITGLAESRGAPDAEPLQALIGNQAMLQLRASGDEATVQGKYQLGASGDPHEREADQVSEQVMRMPAGGRIGALRHEAEESIQRVCDACQPQRETIQMKAAAGGQTRRITPRMSSAISGVRGSGGAPLAAGTQAFMESRFGRGFSEVRVHTDNQASQTAAALGARAYTVGSDVVFGAGQYQPTTKRGQTLIAHELTHVVQQRRAGHSGPQLIRRAELEGTVMSLDAVESDASKKSLMTLSGQVDGPRIYADLPIDRERSHPLKAGSSVTVLSKHQQGLVLKVDCDDVPELPNYWGKQCYALLAYVQLNEPSHAAGARAIARGSRKPSPAPPPANGVCTTVNPSAALVKAKDGSCVGTCRIGLSEGSKVKVLVPEHVKDKRWSAVVVVSQAGGTSTGIRPAKPGDSGLIDHEQFLRGCAVPPTYDPSAPPPTTVDPVEHEIARAGSPAAPKTRSSATDARLTDIGALGDLSRYGGKLAEWAGSAQAPLWSMYREGLRGFVAEASAHHGIASLQPIVDKFKALVTDPRAALPFLLGFVEGVPAGIVQVFRDVADLFAFGAKLIVALMDWYRDKAAGFFEDLSTKASELHKELANLEPEMTKLYNLVLRKPGEFLDALAKGVAGAAVAAYSAARQAAIELINRTLKSLATMSYSEMGRTLGKLFGSLLPDIILSSTAFGVAAVLFKRIVSAIAILKRAFTTLRAVRKAIDLVGSLWKVVKGFFTGFLKGFGGLGRSLWGKLEGILDGIAKFLDDAITSAGKSRTGTVPGRKPVTTLTDAELTHLKASTLDGHGLSVVREHGHLRIRMCSDACGVLGKKLDIALDLAQGDPKLRRKLLDLQKQVVELEDRLARGSISAEEAAGQLRHFGERTRRYAAQHPDLATALDQPYLVGKGKLTPDQWEWLLKKENEQVLAVLGRDAVDARATLQAAGYTPAGTPPTEFRRPAGKPGAPLHVDENNKIRLGSKAGERVADSGKLRKNLEARHKSLPANHEAHHVVPGEAYQKSELFIEIRRRGIDYDIDGATNGIMLPNSETVAKGTGLPVHSGSHADYTKKVLEAADKLVEKAVKKAGKKDIRELSEEQLKAVARQLEGMMEEHIRALPEGQRLK